MTGIVLSAAVRQNLLSLQNTAQLLATTQNDPSTGNKVNSALDNPTSFFTAAALNNRAGDISNLLDGIGNGVQVLQAANTGITSLQSLVASAQSVANQVLQTPVGYSTKSSVSTTAISGATANNLLGTGAGYTDATFAGATSTGTITAAFTSATSTGTSVSNDNSTPAAISTSTQLVGTASSTSNDLAAGAITDGSTLVVDGKTITFSTGTTTASSGSSSTGFTIGIGTGSTATIQTILTDIDAITGGSGSTVVGGKIEIATGTTANLTITGTGNALTGLGLGTGVTLARSGGATSTTALTGSTLLSGATSSSVGSLTNGFSVGDTLVVDGKTLTFVSGTAGANQISTTGTVANLLAAIDTASGNSGTASSISGGVITLHTGTINGTLSISSSNSTALTALGLSGGVTQAATGASPSLSGETLLIAATGGGTASSITFGTGAGQVSSLNQLNAALATNNLQATIDPAGIITLTTSNNAASSTIGAITGTSTAAGKAFNGLVAVAAVADPNAQATRAGLIAQYNNILQQIDTTSQDSSFNGINLLEGDTLNLTFDETGKSTLAIRGVTFNTAGLGLTTLASGTDFLDSNSANTVLTSLGQINTTLRSEASNLGSNLSIVQIRQDFSKNLINVLQTGASNLTLADTNEEAANSQALSTRQSIAVSALALANQSQQSVLQLLR
jgi:flagellin